jgi:general secretion pathway protein D
MLAGLVALPGCANKNLKEGRELIAQGKTDEGILKLKTGVDDDPRNTELKAYYHTQRERQTATLIRQAELEIAASRFEEAQLTLARVLALHPENPRARNLSANLASSQQQSKTLADAERANAGGRPDTAEQLVRQVLAQSPENEAGLTLQRQLNGQRLADEVRVPGLDERFDKVVTMEFRDAPIRSVFDMISRQSGINFVFDKDVRLDTRATIFARETPVAEAVDLVLSTGQLMKKVINDNTLLIYPNQPQKLKDYQSLAVKSFYLGNADPRNTLNMLRTLIKTRDAYIDEKLNLLIIRDTPEAIAVAERLIAQQDIAEPEVMLEVEVLEVQRNRLLDIGAQYPNSFSLLNTIDTITAVPINGGGATTVTNTTLSPLPLTLERLRGINRSDIAINNPTVNLRSELGNVNLLANPRIRVKNREKAKIHIGDKVPIITSNATSNGVVSESVSYLDVGLKLDVEPKVMQQTDVEIKVNLEVSNIVREIRSNSGTLTYQIGTRNAGTVLRLRDGETQMLAGLISESDRSTASRVPGLGDLPIIGRLFASQRDEKNKNEIVLLITPRVLRNTASAQPASNYFPVGTENKIGVSGIKLRRSSLPGTDAPLVPAPSSDNSAPAFPAPLPASTSGYPRIPPIPQLPPDADLPPQFDPTAQASPGGEAIESQPFTTPPSGNSAPDTPAPGFVEPYREARPVEPPLNDGFSVPPIVTVPDESVSGVPDDGGEPPPPTDVPPNILLPQGAALPEGQRFGPISDLPVPNDYDRGIRKPEEAPTAVGGFQQEADNSDAPAEQ